MIIIFAVLGPSLFLFLVRTDPALLKTRSAGKNAAGMMRYLIAVL